MTKEISKAFILQQMEDKFAMRELMPEKFSFSEQVLPVYNIETHLQEWSAGFLEVSVTSGPAPYLFFTIPQAERWFIQAYNVVFMATGAYKVTGVYIHRASEPAADTVYLDLVKGQTVSYAKVLPTPYALNAGDAVYIYVDDYTSTAGLRLYIDFMRERLR